VVMTPPSPPIDHDDAVNNVVWPQCYPPHSPPPTACHRIGYVGHVRRMDASPPQVGVWAEEETRLAEGLLAAFPRPADFLPPKMYGSGQAADSGG
jgi:hypothetical protein